MPQITQVLRRVVLSQLVPALASSTTWMATTLAPVDSREVVRCDRCSLVQFRTNNNVCRRCKLSLDDEPEPEVAQPQPAAEPVMMHRQGLQVATAIRNLRLRSGLSQR